MPSRNRAVNNRFTARSISASEIKPCFTALTSVGYSPHISDRFLLFTARAEASASVFNELVPFVDVSDRTAVRNDVSIEAPLAAQNIVSSFLFAQHGSPFVRL